MRTPTPIPALTEDEVVFVIELIGPKLPNGCMPWLGKPYCSSELHSNTYGIIHLRNKTWVAHRVVYTILRGSIPDGMALDHLCGAASCVNPAHLEPVSSSENLHREGPRNREKIVALARAERAKLADALNC